MEEMTDQITGAVFGAVTRRGHTEVERAVVDAYAEVDDEALSDREALSRTVLAEIMAALDRHLGSEEQVAVLAAAVEDLVDRFATVIEAVPVAICAVDTDGAVRLWNPAAEETFGRDRGEMIGRSFGGLWIDCDDGSEFEGMLARLIEGERIVGEDARHRRPDGSILDTRTWGASLHDRDGTVSGAVFVVLDVTERRGRRQRLAVLNRVLRHNIRNDVNVVRGHVDQLADRLPDDDRSLDVVRHRLANVLDLSDTARRIERIATTDRTERTRLDLVGVLEERIARLRRTYPDCTVDTSVPDGVTVVGHDLLPYAFDNVLENAVEHNDSTRPHVAVEVSMSDAGDETAATVRVRDDGPGLPDVERRVLRTGEETPLTHSTGLGLWLTNWVVRASSGRIAVDCTDTGTTVAVELPTRRVE